MPIEYSTFNERLGIYFNLVKLDEEEIIQFWYDLAHKQRTKKVTEKTKQDTGLATAAFLEALEYSHERDVYVAYISSTTLSTRTAQIEMAMTVTASDPISSHMGIFRNLHYTATKHSHISMKLHGYAAKAISELYKGIKFMVNFPMANMLSIMQEALKDNDTPCSIYQSNENATDNSIIISESEQGLNIEYDGTKYTLDYHQKWFFHNKCLFPQERYGFPMVVATIEDLIGCSDFAADTVLSQ